MNKKVLTLCAGVLLVGGSTVFTVNALNAGNEKVQTTYVAQAADEVAGYLLKEAGANDEIAVWHLIKNDENYFLAPDADGKWFLDLTDGQIKEVAEGNKNVTNVVLNSTTKVLSYKNAAGEEVAFKNGGIYLWSDKETQLDSEDLASAKNPVILGTADEQVLDLRVEKQYVASVSTTATFTATETAYSTDEWSTAISNAQAFVVETRTNDEEKTERVLAFEADGTKFYLKYASKKFSFVPNKEDATAVSNTSAKGAAFQMGENATVYVSDKGALTTDNGKQTKADAEGNAALRMATAKGFVNVEDVEDGTTVYLVADKENKGVDSSSKTIISDFSKLETALSLNPIKSVVVTANSTIAYTQLEEGSKLDDAATALNTWTAKDGHLVILGKYMSASFKADAEKSAAAVALSDEGQLMIAGELIYTKTSGKSITLTKDATTTTGEGEEAVTTANIPAVLYAVTENGVSAQPASAMENGKQYIISQKIEQDVVATAYVAKEFETINAALPGAEYGKEIAIVDGKLIITTDIVPTVLIPVRFTHVIEGVTYYLGWKDNAIDWTDAKYALTWVLTPEGHLVSLPDWKNGNTDRYFAGIGEGLGGEKDASDVKYTPDGIEIDGEDQDVEINLGTEGVPAAIIDECEVPLWKDVPSEAVRLAFEDNGTTYYVKDVDGSLTTSSEEATLWYVTEGIDTNNNRLVYKFQCRKDAASDPNSGYLKVGGATKFSSWEYKNGSALQLVAVDAPGNVVLNASQSKLELGSGVAAAIGLYRSELDQFTAQWLIHRYGSSFQLNFKNHPTYADKEWIGNVFDGADLVPVWWDQNDGLFEIAPENETPWNETAKAFLLKDRNTGLYIVLDYRKGDPNYSNAFTDFVDGGYPFTVLSESNLLDVLKSSTNTLDGKVYYPYFRINYVIGKTAYNANGINQDNVTDATPIECVEVAARPYSSDWYDVAILETDDKAGSGHKDLFVTVVSHCELADTQRPSVSFQNEDNIVHGEDATNNPLNYRYVNIKFKSGANMQFKNELGNWVNLDGKVLGIGHISAGNDEPMPTEADYFLTDKAEGQWAVAMQKDANGNVPDSRKFVFTNRENPEESIYVKSMHALGNNVYAVEYDNASQWATLDYPFGFYTAGNNERNQAMRDTLVITAAEGNLKLTPGKDAFNMDSYANWTKEDLQDRTFQLSIDASTQLYVTENEGKDSHFLGLTDDALKVTNWRLVPMTEARKHDVDGVKYLTQGTDSVYTISNPMGYVNGKFVTYKDTTAIIAYALQNIENNEYLTYDPSQNQTILSMMCDPDSKNYSTSADLGEAYRFVLKEKAKGAQKIESGAYNIIGVNAWEYENDGKGKYVEGDAAGAYYTLDLEKKLYGAATYQKENAGAIEVENAYVQPTSNDIFTIATTASQEYVLATPRDTVRIYGNEENDFLLFEKGQFLNLGNTGDIAPAMVLDTAYIHRPGNNRYQYLLVVNPDYIEPVYDQLHGGDYHLVEPDTMKGRFLVNQIDSAVIDARYHNNKFINDIEADEKELKLGFQWGYRTGDKLHLTDGQNGPVIETIELGTADFNKAKFAFKYVNQAVDETFKVQTAFYDYDAAVKAGSSKAAGVMNNEGYLKSVNGVIVVTNGYTHGEEFLMAPEESAATANESIAAEGAISVTATDGAVIIKGAEGKNVVIATILGKVVANETINSDNETIAVPAGIAVVSVDGESFKVVVK